MPKPLIQILWRCRYCDCLWGEPHDEGCLFASPPEKRCEREVSEDEFMRGEHNAHGWESDGRRVFCPGGVQNAGAAL